MGLSLEDVNLGLALQKERLTAAQVSAGGVARSWTTLQAQVGSAAFVGVDGLTVEVSGLELGVNRAGSDGSVVDYGYVSGDSGARKTALSVLTGPASEQELTLQGSLGELLQVKGHVNLDVFGFVQVEGDFAFEKASEPVTLTLSDASTVQAQVLRVGARNLNAFAGVNGGQSDELGLKLSGVEFGLALMSEQVAAGHTGSRRRRVS